MKSQSYFKVKKGAHKKTKFNNRSPTKENKYKIIFK